MKIIVGLGNPGEEYEMTRHNAGRIILEAIRKEYDGADWEYKKIFDALVSEVKIGKEKVMLVEPETFMNNSGVSVKKLIKSQKAAQDMIVVYDDLDLPLGKLRISYNKSSGGHNGLESIIQQVKTPAFTRFRIGISPQTGAGKTKKPLGEEKVQKHILGAFKEDEVKTLKKLGKKLCEAVEMWVGEGWEKTASLYSNLEV